MENRTSVDRIIANVKAKRPVLAHVLRSHGHLTLGQYASTFGKDKRPSIQPHSDVAEAAYIEAKRTLGNQTAEKVRAQLSNQNAVLTGNHHGPEFVGTSHQGTHIFGLGADPESINVVFATSKINLKNTTNRPMSISLSNGGRVNVFSDRFSSTVMSAAPAFTSEMIDNASRAARKGKLSPKEAEVVQEILSKGYAVPEVLKLGSFADQSVGVNRAIWQMAYHPDAKGMVPDLAFLELEGITKNILLKDLQDPASPFYQTLFNPELRSRVLANLSDVTGCWNNGDMEVLLNSNSSTEAKQEAAKSPGTVFFWGIDNKGQRFPFGLKENQGNPYLVRVDKEDPTYDLRLDPKTLASRLTADSASGQRVISSLFTDYTLVSFIRGFECYGGYRQIEYTTEMQAGYTEALKQVGRNEWAESVANVKTANYITGLAGAITEYGDGSVKRAGAVEIIAQGGFNRTQLDVLKGMNFRDASLLNFLRLYGIFNGEADKEPGLADVTEKDIARYADGRLIKITY